MAVVISMSVLRKKLRDVVDGVRETGDRVFIERQGRPIAVLISWEDYASHFPEDGDEIAKFNQRYPTNQWWQRLLNGQAK